MKTLSAFLAGGAGAAILFLAYATVPLLGIPAGVLSPLPISYVSLRWSTLTGAMACMFGLLLVSLLDGPASGLLFLLQAGMLSLLLTEGLKREVGGSRTIALAVGGTVLTALLLGVAWYARQGVSLPVEIGRGIDASISQTMTMYEKADLPPEVLEQLKGGVTVAGDLLRETWPALAVMGLIITAGVNLLALRRLLPEQVQRAGLAPFIAFKAPDHLVWLLIIAGFARLAPPPWGGSWSLSLLMLAGFLYFLQGMAVLLTLINRSSIGGLLKVFLYSMLLFQPYLVLVVAALGLFDLWGDFRTPRQPQNL